MVITPGTTIKALSLTIPWGPLVMLGHKRNETRSWSTWYRGALAIHSAKGLAGFTEQQISTLCNTDPFRGALIEEYGRYGMVDTVRMPRGSIVAIVSLVGCVPTQNVVATLSDHERAFGNYDPGRWAWQFGDVYRISAPIPVRGQMGLWDWVVPEGVGG